MSRPKFDPSAAKDGKPVTLACLPRRIQTFDSAGNFVGTRLAEAAKRLVDNGLAVPVRNRQGRIVSLHIVGETAEGRRCTASPIARTAHVGTRYSFQERLDGGGRPWDLKRLHGARGGQNYAPSHLRPIFLKVITDCLTKPE